MAIVLDGTSGITTPDLESSGPVSGTTANFSGNVTLGSSVLATPSGSAPSYTCRAWVNFNGTGTVAIRASGNVSSITDNGTGDYTVNFTNAMPDANYSTVLSRGGQPSTGFIIQFDDVPQTTNSVRIRAVNQANNALQDTTTNYVAIFR
jgi:hypothetical protein